MKRSHDLSGLIKFAGRPEWRDHLRDALDDHLGPALDEFDLEHRDGCWLIRLIRPLA